MPDSSQDLVQRAARGDRAALDSLLVRHLPALNAFIRLRAGAALQRDTTEDLAQSVCREVLAGLDQHEFRGEAAFKNWLFTAAANKIVDRQRYHQAQRRDVRREQHAGPQGDDGSVSLLGQYAVLCSPSMAVSAREEVERIEAAFARLPDAYREVLTLSRLVGLGYAEIGAQTGRTETAVRGMVARGLARLTELLAG